MGSQSRRWHHWPSGPCRPRCLASWGRRRSKEETRIEHRCQQHKPSTRQRHLQRRAMPVPRHRLHCPPGPYRPRCLASWAQLEHTHPVCWDFVDVFHDLQLWELGGLVHGMPLSWSQDGILMTFSTVGDCGISTVLSTTSTCGTPRLHISAAASLRTVELVLGRLLMPNWQRRCHLFRRVSDEAATPQEEGTTNSPPIWRLHKMLQRLDGLMVIPRWPEPQSHRITAGADAAPRLCFFFVLSLSSFSSSSSFPLSSRGRKIRSSRTVSRQRHHSTAMGTKNTVMTTEREQKVVSGRRS